jgi:spore coat polysaccharide biosynthesis protein SpsF
MNVLAIVQARMNSTRLPGKVLKPIAGKPMIARVVERLQQSLLIDKIIVATSDQPQDDPIVQEMEKYCDVFRGPLDDVLGRYHLAANRYECSDILRVTGDCPLIDAREVNRAINKYAQGNYDYFTNDNHAGKAASGFDIEIFSYEILKRAHRNLFEPEKREHVVIKWIMENQELFKIARLLLPEWCYRMRLSVDDEVDYRLVNGVFTALYELNPAFSIEDVRKFIGIPR